jgi:hypothetical protein
MEGFVVVAFIFAVASAAPLAESQDTAGHMAQEMAPSSYRGRAGLTGDDVIAQMLQHDLCESYSSTRQSGRRRSETSRTNCLRWRVRVEYQTPDKKTFNKTTEKESSIVRHLVFDQLIQSGSETSSGREHHNSAITIANAD